MGRGWHVTYGNLYSDLLDYVVFSVLILLRAYDCGNFVLRAKQPEAERPYRAFGYPSFFTLYRVGAGNHVCFSALQDANRWPGLVIVASGRSGLPVVVTAGNASRTRGISRYSCKGSTAAPYNA